MNTWEVCANKVYSILKEKIAVNLILEANGDVVIPNEEKIAEIPRGCARRNFGT